MRFRKDTPVKIIVLGAGGTGGFVVQHLYQMVQVLQCPVRIILCDGDLVEEKNLIRQAFLPQDIRKNKARVLAERYAAAYGMACEYQPAYVETEKALLTLVEPDQIPDYIHEQQVILLGCVDNNKTRQLCDRVFYQMDNLIYIDSGNGASTGQVVCGIRRNGRTLFPPVCKQYPDMLEETDRLPSELSCSERAQSAPQSIAANITASTKVLEFLYNILVVGDLTTKHVCFSTRSMSAYAEVVVKPKRTKKTKRRDRHDRNLL